MSREYKGDTIGMYEDGQKANVNKNKTEVVTEHAHTGKNTCNPLTLFAVQSRS
jgi:hypothetical protein